MEDSHFFHREELERILSAIKGRTLGEIDINHVFDKTIEHPKVTGIAGDVIEQSVLGYPADQKQRPDLDVDGVPTELKTTGMRLRLVDGKDVYFAKEPASITAVSIPTITGEHFDDSSFWHKIEHMLFVFYEYESKRTVPAAEYARFQVKGHRFHEFSEEEVTVLRRDWQMIHDFIAEIQQKYTEEEAVQHYPELSTLLNKKLEFLDTAPKYPHPPRFRLRKRVVDTIIQQAFPVEKLEKLPDSYVGYNDIEKKCIQLSNEYSGYSIDTLLHVFNIRDEQKDSNQLAEILIVKMFGGKSNSLLRVELFKKFGYIGRSVIISATEKRTEDLKLTPVDFDDITEPYAEDDLRDESEDHTLRDKTFEDSDLYTFFQDTKILFAVFKERPRSDGSLYIRDSIFLGFKILSLQSDELLSAARVTWNETRELINSGNLRLVPTLNALGEQRYTSKTRLPMSAPNLPKSKDHIVFFRGSGADATKKTEYFGVPMYHQDYWIKGTKIIDTLSKIPYLKSHSTCPFALIEHPIFGFGEIIAVGCSFADTPYAQLSLHDDWDSNITALKGNFKVIHRKKGEGTIQEYIVQFRLCEYRITPNELDSGDFRMVKRYEAPESL